jgi:hypothetical protein
MSLKTAHALALLAVLLLILTVGAVTCSATRTAPIAPTVSVAPTPTSKVSRSPDAGAKRKEEINSRETGSPGAYCGKSRLGRTFVRAGKTYACKGPKPYRWRRTV